MKIGILGISEGNGHPYSWSAIINGYDQEMMEACPFPVIPEYLGKEVCPSSEFKGAEISHIWTQNWEETLKIANTCYIEYPTRSLEELISNVDALVVARDDSEKHYEFAKGAVEKGMPVFLDKQLGTNKTKAEKMINMERYPGQISCCSGLKYSDCMHMTKNQREKIGKIKRIEGITPKSWAKYSVHLHQSLFNIIGYDNKIKISKICKNADKALVEYQCEDMSIMMHADGINSTEKIKLIVTGELGREILIFEDVYQSFSKMLKTFIQCVEEEKIMTSRKEMLAIANMVGLGLD